MARRHKFKEFEKADSVTVTPTGTLATDKFYTGFSSLALRKVHSLVRRVGSERPVKLVQPPHRQWRQLIGVPEYSSTGDPTHYIEWADQIEWWRVPDRAFVLFRNYTLWPLALTTDAQKSDFDQKDNALIALSTHTMFHSLGQREDAREYFGIYRALLDEAIKDETTEPDSSRVPRRTSEQQGQLGQFWLDPFQREAP